MRQLWHLHNSPFIQLKCVVTATKTHVVLSLCHGLLEGKEVSLRLDT